MIDKQKYLYWAKNDDKLTDEIVWREMYSRIGYIFHLIQMVEYNIANILAIEEFEKETLKTFTYDELANIKRKITNKYKKLTKMTFGCLAREIEGSQYLQEIDIDALNDLVKYRNYLAHNCFKEKLIDNKLHNIQDIDNFVDELNCFEGTIAILNDFLVEIFKQKNIKSIFVFK